MHSICPRPSHSAGSTETHSPFIGPPCHEQFLVISHIFMSRPSQAPPPPVPDPEPDPDDPESVSVSVPSDPPLLEPSSLVVDEDVVVLDVEAIVVAEAVMPVEVESVSVSPSDPSPPPSSPQAGWRRIAAKPIVR